MLSLVPVVGLARPRRPLGVAALLVVPLPLAQRLLVTRLLVALLLVALLLVPGGHAWAEDADLEPPAPWVFFPTPDDATAATIDALVENSFADLNKVVEARELLVRRLGVWSAARLGRELTEGRHQEAVLNAALTVAALRSHVGAAPQLAPLVRPLLATVRAPEEWRRLSGLLALGAFRGPEGVGRPRRRPDALIPLDPVLEARRLLEGEALEVLAGQLRDQSVVCRSAAALALGKIGGSTARAHLVLGSLPRDAAVEPAMALLLAVGLLGVGGDFDGDQRFGEALADGEWRLRAAAALGSALQIVSQPAPAWTDAPTRWLRAIGSVEARTGRDAAEAVFARGCMAWKAQRADLWEQVLTTAVTTGSHEAAAAAAQALAWCEDRALRAKALAQLLENARALKQPVLASFLLRAGWDGTLEGVRACRSWLGNPAQQPRAEKEQDVRFHAVVGLLRALHENRFPEPAARVQALDALDAAVERGLDRDAPVLARLQALAAERSALRADPARRLPAEALATVEAACDCRYGLMARDIRDAAITRANALIYDEVFALGSLRPLGGGGSREKDKDGSAKRFLQRHLAAWPYLSRLDLLADRGRRPAQTLAYDDPAMAIDRGPR